MDRRQLDRAQPDRQGWICDRRVSLRLHDLRKDEVEIGSNQLHDETSTCVVMRYLQGMDPSPGSFERSLVAVICRNVSERFS